MAGSERGWALAAAGAVAATLAVQAQQPPPFRGGVNVVRIDVIVSSDDGLPVMDLAAADFEVREDGKPQTIDTFKLVDADPGFLSSGAVPATIRNESDEEREAARDEVRLFAIFLDDYHVRWANSVRAREAVARFVDLHVGPNDLLLVMDPLTPIAAARFTRNHAAAARRIRQFVGRADDMNPANDFEREYWCHDPATIRSIRSQVTATALDSLLERMGFLKEGRKTLIIVSEGFVPRPSSHIRACNSFGGGGRSAVWDLELLDLYETANQNNVSIYPVDPEGLSTNLGFAAGHEALRFLALETDGRAIFNSSDLTRAMQQIVRDASAYYLIGYSSPAESDGRFHEVDVRVRRRGVNVRARKGFRALTAVDAARAAAPRKPPPPAAITKAVEAMAPDRSRLIRTWVGMRQGEAGGASVTFAWERVEGDAAKEIGAVAMTATTPAGRSDVRWPIDRAPDGGIARFDAVQGAMQIRVTVTGRSGELLDSEVREITVPDLSAALFGTPELFRGRTVRDIQRLRSAADARPAATRVFSRSDRLLIRVPLHGAAAASIEVTARVLEGSSGALASAPVARSQSESAIEFEVPLASLANGTYVVEINAAAAARQQDALVAFRVAG